MRGPTGVKGATGPTGPSASAAVTLVTGTPVTGDKVVGDNFTATATCTGGRTLIGGGVHVTQGTGGQPSKAVATDSYPSTPGVNGVWTAGMQITVAGNAGSATPTVTAYGYCSL